MHTLNTPDIAQVAPPEPRDLPRHDWHSFVEAYPSKASEFDQEHVGTYARPFLESIEPQRGPSLLLMELLREGVESDDPETLANAVKIVLAHRHATPRLRLACRGFMDRWNRLRAEHASNFTNENIRASR